MQRMLSVILTLLALAGTAPLLTACYTTAGAGGSRDDAPAELDQAAACSFVAKRGRTFSPIRSIDFRT